MNYYIYSPCNEIIEKIVKDFRFHYDRENVNKRVYVVLASAENYYANVNKLNKHIYDSVNKFSAIKTKIKTLSNYNDMLVCYIESSFKITALQKSLSLSENYFSNNCTIPYIPVIFSGSENIENKAIIKLQEMLKNRSFFIRKLELLISYNYSEKREKIAEFIL